MGTRTTTYLPCPSCSKESEQYDAPTCILWSWICNHCGWKDPRSYYEAPEDVIELLTREEAKEKKLILDCPECKEDMTWWEEKEYGKCINCNQETT